MPGQFGNKGGRRKSAYQEQIDATFHVGLWQVEQEVKRLEEKIASGCYSGRDIFSLMVLQKNEKMVKTLADKVLPDHVDITSGGNPINVELSEMIAKKNALAK